MASRDNSLVRQPTRAVAIEERSPYNRFLVFIFALFFGGWGLHRFYTGRFLSGLIWFLTGGLFLFGWFYDIFMIALGRFRDSEGRVLGPPQYEHRQMLTTDQPIPARASRDPRDGSVGAAGGQMNGPQRQRGPREAPVEPVAEEDLYLEEAMRDPLAEKFDQLEREIEENQGRDGSVEW